MLWILVGAVLVTGSAIANSWMDITGKNTIPVKPSVAPQNEISEPKMPRLSPFVPVIDA
ncbi:MAG: hypothetical protein LDL41_11565 [Coleofasciculus sp. S288]|nr:hypothetical protein [Coleofasciculus sp. S288]